jgi:small-conductance mechanosensitive channel
MESTSPDVNRLLDVNRELSAEVAKQTRRADLNRQDAEKLSDECGRNNARHNALYTAVRDALNNLPKSAKECRALCEAALKA